MHEEQHAVVRPRNVAPRIEAPIVVRLAELEQKCKMLEEGLTQIAQRDACDIQHLAAAIGIDLPSSTGQQMAGGARGGSY